MTFTETTIETESVFAIALKHVPPSGVGTRALLEVLDRLMPRDTPIDSRLIQPNGVAIGGSEARTCLKILADLLGPIHPAVIQAGNDLREELKK